MSFKKMEYDCELSGDSNNNQDDIRRSIEVLNSQQRIEWRNVVSDFFLRVAHQCIKCSQYSIYFRKSMPETVKLALASEKMVSYIGDPRYQQAGRNVEVMNPPSLNMIGYMRTRVRRLLKMPEAEQESIRTMRAGLRYFDEALYQYDEIARERAHYSESRMITNVRTSIRVLIKELDALTKDDLRIWPPVFGLMRLEKRYAVLSDMVNSVMYGINTKLYETQLKKHEAVKTDETASEQETK